MYVPLYSYPYYQEEIIQQDDELSSVAAQPEPPARTIFERRPTTAGAEVEEGREAGEIASSSSPGSASGASGLAVKAGAKESPADILPATVLIFRDGHRQEVHDYAIVGGNLFDLGTAHVMKKIPLAMLDLDATHKENDLNGVDFRVP